MSKPRLFLHIGLNKTGTSSIQHSLMVNEARLLEAGIYLPDRLGRSDGGHHLAAAILREKGPEVFLDYLKKGKNSPVTVVSAESFLQLFKAPARLIGLSKALHPQFETQIILFLRRQDYLKESVFSQVAKHHFQGTIQEHQSYLYNFVPYVSNLEHAFERQNVHIVIYRDDQRFDAWTAFCRVLGISSNDYPLSTGHTNSSLPRRKTLALSIMPKSSRAAAEVAINVIANSDCIHDDGIKWLMSPDERRRFLQRYLKGNREICNRYEPDGGAFFCSDEMPTSNWFPPAPISPQEWAAFAAAIATRVAKPAPRKRHLLALKTL